jgi:RNA polymerase sigma factor (sigma-70 family)
MINESISHERHPLEAEITNRFLDNPDEESFTALFEIFSPQLVAFFRTRSREVASAEDLAQEVMFTVYRKVGQVRDRNSFRGWLFKIAHSVLCRHYAKSREVKTVDLTALESQLAAAQVPPGTPLFELRNWMSFLDERERDLMMLRFVEEWEYHEIAAARDTPIGTVQWRIFNSKKKLAKHLASRANMPRQAAA